MMANTANVLETVESGVFDKLLKLLKETDLSKYEYVYICARTNGSKIKGAWFNTSKDVVFNVEKYFCNYRQLVKTYEVEFLYDAETRIFNFSNEHQWNSLRGLRAIVIDAEIQLRRSALQMLSENKSFHQVINAAFSKTKSTEKSGFPVSLFKTKQYLISDSAAAPIELFRGNTVVSTCEINVSSVKKTISLMTAWLANQVNENGYANYKYWPSRGHYSSANNPIRQWMATVCLNRCAVAYKNAQLQNIAYKNLTYNLETTFRESDGLGYIWMNGTAKLGALSLAALAIFESPLRKKYLNHEYKLRNTIYALSNSNGSFDTFLIPRWRKDNQNFYSGEALLFLATRYSISRNPDELSRIMDAFNYYRDWHRSNRNPAFVPWHTQAYFLVWQTTKNEALKDFIFEMNDWLLSMQQWDSAEFPDMQGRFYDPKRSHFGPPHASSTGVYLEGLIDAFSLAKQVEDDVRAEKYRVAIVRGIRSIMQLQFKDNNDCFYVENINRVLGGVRTTVYDNTIRIDNVQHALIALMKIASRFSNEEYLFNESSHLSNKIKSNSSMCNSHYFDCCPKGKMLDTSKILCFKLRGFKVDIHEMQRDFEERIRNIKATPYYHVNVPYEGWAITSRDGSASDGVKIISGNERILNGISVGSAKIKTDVCTDFLEGVINKLDEMGLNCFRARYMSMRCEGFDMNFHRDARQESWRLHIPLYTNESCFFEWRDEAGDIKKVHLPADGSAYLVRVDELHRAVNGSENNLERIHFLTSLESLPSIFMVDESFALFSNF